MAIIFREVKRAIIFREAYSGDIVTADDIYCPRNKLEEWLLRVPIFRKTLAKIAKKNTVRRDYNLFEEKIHPIGVWDGNGGIVLFPEKPVWDVDVEE